MVKSQEWLDQNYPKKAKEIEVEDEKFQGQLVIENYSQLEKLYLQNVKTIDKITLKNLPQLQECTIWNCGIQDLIITNCPQLKKMNLRRNLLTNLEFLKSLENLKELEIDKNMEMSSGLEYLPESLEVFSYENTKLNENLDYYKGDWKTCMKDVQELIRQVKENPQELLKNIRDLREQAKLEAEIQELEKKINNVEIEHFKEKIKIKEEFQKREKELLDGLIIFKEIQQQKAKIAEIYASFDSEKELIQELVNEYLVLLKTKKKSSSVGYGETKFLGLKSEISSRLNRENKEKVETILTECKKLADWELELENKRVQIEENRELETEQSKSFAFEKEIKKLTNLVKFYKEKIIQAYITFFKEKELLKELINAHLEYTKFKKENLNSLDYDEKCEEYEERIQVLKKQLRSKLTKENMNEVRNILKDCEEFAHYENELQTKISSDQKLIESHQVINQITYNISNLNPGHAIIGNQMEPQEDLHYQIGEVLESKMIIPPKTL